jgi:sugar/nucleoside kinase (ribokinase family)
MDVSSDLTELARTPIVVVSAGVKSILDISRTLETLETFGVPTVSFGTDDYPAFFSPSSGVPTPARVDSAHEVARAYWATQMLGMTNGMLVAVPNMDPAGEAVEQAIQETLVEADAMGIQGRDVTPYILKRVSEKTGECCVRAINMVMYLISMEIYSFKLGGDSLRSNTSLVKNNARVGADIAISIAEQSKQYSKEPQKSTSTIFITSSKPIPTKGNEPPAPVENSRVVVMGGSVVDLMAKPKEDQELIMKTSNPGYCIESDGGVGRNIAEVLARLNTKPILYSAVGDDSRGGALLSRMKESYDLGEERQCISVVSELNTATYLAVLNEEGDLHTAVADMDVLADIPVPHNETLSHAEFLILDANPSKERLVEAAQAAKELNVKVCFEPTSVPKASLVRNERDFMSTLNYAFPNLDELLAMANVPSTTEKESLFENEFERLKLVATAVLNKMSEEDAHLVITLGSEGVFLASRNGHSSIIPKEEFIHFPVTEVVEVENSTGAGDTLVGGFVAALLDDRNEAEAVQFGMECACKSLKCFDHAISPHF